MSTHSLKETYRNTNQKLQEKKETQKLLNASTTTATSVKGTKRKHTLGWHIASLNNSISFHIAPLTPYHCILHRIAGLVVKASASGAEDPRFESGLRRDFSGSSHTSDLIICTPVATLPGAWHYRVSAGTGGPDVSIL